MESCCYLWQKNQMKYVGMTFYGIIEHYKHKHCLQKEEDTQLCKQIVTTQWFQALQCVPVHWL